MTMKIGDVAAAAGVKVATIRYYERRGIIAAPERTASGYRQYDQGAVDRIRFVRRAQELGFTLREIQELLALRVHDAASCERVEQATRTKLDSVESRIRELERLKDVLLELVDACEAREATSECPVLAVLDDAERQ